MGSRSKVNVKSRGSNLNVKVNVWCVAVDIRGSACRVQQKAITLKFGVKDGHYRSKGFVYVSVISRVFVDNLADAVD